MEPETLVQLDPAKILVIPADNPRYGTKRLRVESLAENIKEVGGVLNPVEVTPLSGDKAHSHKLVVGFTRHAAVTLLNTSEGAGLLIPAIVRDVPDELTVLKHQLAENMERENLSPMDQAVAIKRLLDAKVSRGDIRRIFSRPGGRKGLQTQPASNAYVNMTLSFLDLPKPIQAKIHDGLVGVAAAYELTKVSADKRTSVLERAESDRQAAIDREEKEEEKYLKAEAKITEVQKEEEETATALSNAKMEVEASQKLVDDTTAKAAAAYKAMKTAPKAASAQKGAQEHFKSAEVDSKGAEKKLVAAQKVLEKLEGKVKSLADTAAQHKEKLAQARKEAGPKKPEKAKAIGAAQVKQAARAEGEHSGYVKLSANDIRKVIADLCLPGTYPTVMKIAQAFMECFDGISTPKQLYNGLAVLTGERTAADKRSVDVPKEKKK